MRATLRTILLTISTLGCAMNDQARPRPHTQPDSSESLRGFASFRGGRVAFETSGRGEPALVFVHGWAASRGFWHPQMQAPCSGRRVAVDLLGHGESDKPMDGYDMDTLAEGVCAVLDELGIERAVLVGHSNGVPVVRQLYRRHPERVLALVAVDGPLRQEIAPPMAQWFRETMSRPDAAEFLISMAEQTPAGSLSSEDHELIKASARATPLHVHRGGLEGMLDASIWAEDAIGVPLLVLRSKPLDSQYEALLGRLNPRVQIEVWSDSSHFLSLERPQRFEALLAEFLAAA